MQKVQTDRQIGYIYIGIDIVWMEVASTPDLADRSEQQARKGTHVCFVADHSGKAKHLSKILVTLVQEASSNVSANNLQAVKAARQIDCC